MIWEWESILNALMGGGLIGLAASLMLFFNGRVTGISGIYSGIFRKITPDFYWRVALVMGLVAGGALAYQMDPELFVNSTDRNWFHLGLAGLFVGFGTLLGSGCTSGHGICGLSRLSMRSLVATMSFMALGFATATVLGRFL